MVFIILITICARSGKQLRIVNSSSSAIHWEVEANDFRRPITQDNASLALDRVKQSRFLNARGLTNRF